MSALLLGMLLQFGEHAELEASLQVPLQSRSQARNFLVRLAHPGAARPRSLRWRVDLLAPRGSSVLNWRGKARVQGKELVIPIALRAHPGLPHGLYSVRLRVSAAGRESVEQSWPTLLGPAPVFVNAAPAARPPYSVHYANLHSQTGDSDGGGALPDCHSAQAPQSSSLGPPQAYAYAQQHGLQALMTSELFVRLPLMRSTQRT